MVTFSDSGLFQSNSKIQDDIRSLANHYFKKDETIHIGVKSQFKEYIIASDENILIYKRGFMTGNTFGELVFKVGFDVVSAVELRLQALGAGYIEVIGYGVNNKKPNVWNFDKDTDPAKLENCFSAGRGGKKILEPTYKKLSELLENYRNTSTEQTNETHSSKFDEVKKFKELLDLGIITPEEFDKKRNELLNI